MRTIQLLLFFILIAIAIRTRSQVSIRLSDNVTLGWHPNIETYFIAERLAVQHIGNYVFTQKDSLYRHQPLVYAAYQEFNAYVNSPCITRIAQLLAYFRDTYYDNAEVIRYLVSRPTFPIYPDHRPFADSAIFHPEIYPATLKLVGELADSLCSFYRSASVGKFLKRYRKYYQGAINEVRKDVRADWFKSMEDYYGEHFIAYRMYIMPLMPITYGEDNYRAFGPVMHTANGKIAGMFFSSSKMILPGKSPLQLHEFGFDNPVVTRLLTVHEFGHSFVNPHVDSLSAVYMKDTALFTPAWQRVMESVYISNWRTCVIEHLVRLGEIRIAVSRGDTAEAARLRLEYIVNSHFILIPLLENRIVAFEQNRKKYPTFTSFLPQLLAVFHELTPEKVDELLTAQLRSG